MNNETPEKFYAYGRKPTQGASITGFYAYPHEDVVSLAKEFLDASGATLGIIAQLEPTALFDTVPIIIYPEKLDSTTYEMLSELLNWIDQIRSDIQNGTKAPWYGLYLAGENE